MTNAKHRIMNDKAMIFSLSMRDPARRKIFGICNRLALATFTAARRVANIQHTMRYTELAPDLLRDI